MPPFCLNAFFIGWLSAALCHVSLSATDVIVQKVCSPASFPDSQMPLSLVTSRSRFAQVFVREKKAPEEETDPISQQITLVVVVKWCHVVISLYSAFSFFAEVIDSNFLCLIWTLLKYVLEKFVNKFQVFGMYNLSYFYPHCDQINLDSMSQWQALILRLNWQYKLSHLVEFCHESSQVKIRVYLSKSRKLFLSRKSFLFDSFTH